MKFNGKIFIKENGKSLIPTFSQLIKLNEDKELPYMEDYEFLGDGKMILTTPDGQRIMFIESDEVDTEMDYSPAGSGVDHNNGTINYYNEDGDIRAVVNVYSSTGDPDSPDWEPEDVERFEHVVPETAESDVNIDEVIEQLKNRFPDIEGITAANEWDPSYERGIFLGDAGEGGMIGDVPAANYYNEAGSDIYDDFGVHNELVAALTEFGYYPEWNDPGTLLAFE